jgi:hypothetical protein
VAPGGLPPWWEGPELHEDATALHDGDLRTVHRPGDPVDGDESACGCPAAEETVEEKPQSRLTRVGGLRAPRRLRPLRGPERDA